MADASTPTSTPGALPGPVPQQPVDPYAQQQAGAYAQQHGAPYPQPGRYAPQQGVPYPQQPGPYAQAGPYGRPAAAAQAGPYGQPSGPGGTPPARRGRGWLVALVAGLVVVVLLLLAAGAALLVRLAGGDGDPVDPDPVGPGAAGPVASVEDVDTATVQIVSQGSFVDPEAGAVSDAAGAGTGFFVDADGTAVTNNHVVTGAATLEVYVAGETEPRNARVLGTSECSDLAVIDVEGEGFPFLELAPQAPGTGVEVFAAGFPLGDPEFTLTSGIVSKASASGETGWASVDDVVEHSATINPGNSGGPLVDASGRVVAVNYAGSSETDQYFAIAAPTLGSVVDQLRQGRSVDSLGINGQAMRTEDGSLSGVFVAAVESGSPAAALGLAGGDVVTRMEGLSLATDGTMADYCDVLRTQGADAEISAQVLRPSTGEVLQGSFGSGVPLAVFETLGSELEEEVPVEGVGPATYSGYTTVTDDSGSISLEVPVEWAQVDGAPLEDGSPALVATPDLDAFSSGFTTSGVVIASVEGSSDPGQALQDMLTGMGATDACPTSEGPQPYDDGLYTGTYELREGCEGTDAAFAGIVAVPEGGDFMVFVGIQVVGQADLEALDRIIQSFVVTP
ncbi:S1C family serine protease [Aquipuribacter hungaricus]|uniref:Trypsin-like peptidase domain-containing protein n=1 Tax=Aquipuribacter hungaricus TaxID=545624 RepID=A0ABV7WAB1_9MICO